MMIKIYFWFIVIVIITAVSVGLYAIYLHIFGGIIIPNTLEAAYLIGAFTMMTPTITRYFIIKTTSINDGDERSPEYLIKFVNNLKAYKMAIDDFFKYKCSIVRSDEITSAIIFESNIHTFSFFYQTLAAGALIIFASFLDAVSTHLLWFLLFIIIIMFILMFKHTDREYQTYLLPSNKEIIENYENKFFVRILSIIAKNLPPLKSIITSGRAVVLALNIYVTIAVYIKLKGQL